MAGLRFAVLNCYPAGVWNHGSQLWVDALRSEGEEWHIVDALEGHMAEASTFQGIVVTGSPSAVYDKAPWMEKLAAFVRGCYVASDGADGRTGPRVIGGCFGAQMIGHAMGGLVEAQGFGVLRAEVLTTTPAFRALAQGPVQKGSSAVPAGSSPVAECQSFRLIESHGDCVRTLPPDTVLLASSPSCVNELFLTGKNMLGIQAHPEFRVKEEVQENLWPRLLRKQKEAAEAAGTPWGEAEALANEEALSTFAQPLGDEAMLAILRAFIKGKG